MSLIEEALRKVQQPLPGDGSKQPAKQPAAQAPASAPSPAAEPVIHSWSAASAPAAPKAARPRRWSWPLTVPRPLPAAAGAVALAALLVAGGVFWLGRMTGARTVRMKSKPGPVAAGAPAPSPSAVLQQTAHEDLVLSGVVVGVGDPYAVINGQILAVGDKIAGATVLNITPSVVSVRLENGREGELRVPR